MTAMKWIVKIVFWIVCILSIEPTVHAQTVVTLRIVDDFTKQGIPVVRVTMNENSPYSKDQFTANNGKTSFIVATDDSISFHFYHPNYELADSLIKQRFAGNIDDTTTLLVRMNLVKFNEIPEVVIKPFGKPDTVFQSKRVSVHDFEFLKNGNILLLTYPKNMHKETELLVYDGATVLTQLNLPNKGTELIRDFKGNPHVVSDKNVFGIIVDSAAIQIQQLDKVYFMTYIAPIVDTSITNYYFSNFNPIYPAFDYFSFDQWDETYKKILKIEDKLMMELYRSEYKWADIRTKLWAKEKENETGIDAEIWVGANYFTQSIYYKQLYAPLFVYNDTVLVFDHYKNWMYRFSRVGNMIDSLPIYFHLQPKQTGWKKQLIQDQVTGQIYLLFDNAGWMSLKRFDVKTGKIAETIPLSFRYADKILIRDNSVYYTYRPFETAQKKFLYKERFRIGS